MELRLIRHTFTSESTIGTISLNDEPICEILEDVDRLLEKRPESKVYGKSAIPRGRYEIVVTMSNRFARMLPLLVAVPGFEGIRIHPGNTAADTDGCLLPGTTAAHNFVGNSRVAFDILNSTILRAIHQREKVFVTIL